MTSPAPSGSPSRQRVAGLALLGIGVVAGIIGLASVFLDTGNGGPTAAPQPATAITPAPGATPSPGTGPSPGTALPPGTETPPAASPGAPPATDGNPVTVPTFDSTPIPNPGGAAPPPPPAPAPAPGGGDAGTQVEGGPSGVVRGPIRVYNNSTISGLATVAAEDFRAAGWEVAVVANYPFGIISTTTVYYRPGTSEQAAAEELGREFGLRVHERFEGLRDASPGVIVIITNDYPDA